MKIQLFFFLFLCSSGILAQDTLFSPEVADSLYLEEEGLEEDGRIEERPPYHPPPLESMAVRTMDGKQWEEATQGLDYSKDVPKPPKERKPNNNNPGISAIDWTSLTQGLGSFFQALAVILAAIGIAYGIWRMLQNPRNRVIARDGVEITLDNLDAYLDETDLDRFLREALAQGNYSLAIRLYYLQIIKDLSAKDAIRWSREKTNRDYLREMSGHPLADAFRQTTHTYERVWYGNQMVSAQDYMQLEPQFKNLVIQIAH